MREKMSAVIKTLSLNEKTYHGVTITPTLINFFFGKNGVGKTTIADNIKNMTQGLPEYDVLVYDRNFISRNIKEDEAFPGVFSINDENIEKQEQIEKKQVQLQELGKQYADKKKFLRQRKIRRKFLKRIYLPVVGRLTQKCAQDFLFRWKEKEEANLYSSKNF